ATYTNFLKRWKGYPIADDALARFDAKGAELLDKIDTGSDAQRARSLKYFARAWSDFPVAVEATKRRNAAAASVLGKIKALTDKRKKVTGLDAFIRTYGDTPSAADAKAARGEISKSSGR
ncbi:MAG: hypothetical protein ISS78_05240, partial [Phycisphaerae bacterium]|nr:hypothetical protein [Phycisphaerae bacterium]